MIFLSSCENIAPIYQYKHKFNSCAIRCFDYAELETVDDKECGKDFQTNLKLPASFCDGVFGPSPKDYAEEIKPKAKEAIQECKDQSQR
jgi:hypothetical protein